MFLKTMSKHKVAPQALRLRVEIIDLFAKRYGEKIKHKFLVYLMNRRSHKLKIRNNFFIFSLHCF